jgi:lysylphosphatidylglycerol synthetase-like protein (DUF2156 family)
MRSLLSRLMLIAVAFILAATAFAIAFVFLCDALFLILEFYLSPPLAALATAGVFVLLGLLALLLTRAKPKPRKSPGIRKRQRGLPFSSASWSAPVHACAVRLLTF